MNYSQQQLDIFTEVKNGTSVLVNAVAGSGKSTTLAALAKQLTGRILVVVFNNNTAIELQAMMPSNVIVATAHKIGNALVKSNSNTKLKWNKWLHDKKFGNIDKKFNQLMFFALKDQGFEKTELTQMTNYLKDVVDKIRLTLTDYKDEIAVEQMLLHYGLPFVRYDLIVESMNRMNKAFINDSWVDFADQIYLPSYFNMSINENTELNGKKVGKFDYVMLDESQDLSDSYIALVEKYMSKDTIVIAAGDFYQAINSFNSSRIDSIYRVQERFNLKSMPLTITYRCPQKVVNMVNDLFDVNMICGNDRQGNIINISLDEIVDYAAPGDLIIGRNVNGRDAVLIPIMQQLIKKSIPCKLLGFDISASIKNHCGKLFDDNEVLDFDSYVKVMQYAEDTKTNILAKKWSLDVANSVYNNIVMIADLIEFYTDNYSGTWENFASWVYKIENEKGNAVLISTIHKAKGQGNANLFIANYSQLPAIRQTALDWEIQSEKNVHYVALTRSADTLYLVN